MRWYRISRAAVPLLAVATLVAACRTVPPGAASPSDPSPARPAYDLVIRGGQLVDGTGAAPRRGDLAIQGDRVAAVGELGPHQALQVIEAEGLVVAPGFINPHSHTHDFINPYADPDATASLMQGITTELGGVDGRSPLPIGAELARLEREGTGVNFGLFVGQGSVRAKVMGEDASPASAQQLEAMRELVRQGMADGAFGVSTGLEYIPGKYASQAEITALVAEAQPYGGLYSTHLRSEGNELVEAVQEALTIAARAGVPLNLSHLKVVGYRNWGKEEQVITLVEEAIGQGRRVFADVYPYLAPDYAINRPLSEWAGVLPPEHVLITAAGDPNLPGKSLAEAAAYLGISPEETVRLLTGDPDLRVVAQVSSVTAMRRFYQLPWTVVSTDGESQPKLADPAAARQFHPRSYGTYPLLLGQHVREEGRMPLEAMVRKMTGAVAEQVGLKDRGCLRAGCFADVVIFDPRTVADRTTWLSPQEYPAGIFHVLVNGTLAVKDGQRLPGRPGRVLGRGR